MYKNYTIYKEKKNPQVIKNSIINPYNAGLNV